MRAAGDLAWLYAVDNLTQPYPVELVMVQNPGRLPWVMIGEAERTVGTARGGRHEAVFQVAQDAVRDCGEVIDLSVLALPSWAAASRD